MIADLLTQAGKRLQTAGFSADEAAILLAATLNVDRTYLYSQGETKISQEQLTVFTDYLDQRLAGQPVAYILDYKDFYNRRFIVNPDVLIPRPDSEVLITTALELLKNLPATSYQPLAILDIGTGSGCLIITIALETAGRFNYLGTDISLPALAVAQENADSLQAKVSFLPSDLLDDIPLQKFNLILANLPYLQPEQLNESSIMKEPQLALYGGTDGLMYYERLLKTVANYLQPDGILLLEIDPGQKDLLTSLIQQQPIKWQLEFINDLSGRIRVAKLSL